MVPAAAGVNFEVILGEIEFRAEVPANAFLFKRVPQNFSENNIQGCRLTREAGLYKHRREQAVVIGETGGQIPNRGPAVGSRL